jgi:hypothetical protein
MKRYGLKNVTAEVITEAKNNISLRVKRAFFTRFIESFLIGISFVRILEYDLECLVDLNRARRGRFCED